MKKAKNLLLLIFTFVLGSLIFATNVEAQEGIVNKDMTNAEIQAVVDGFDTIIFEEGTYNDIVLKLKDVTKTFITNGEVIFTSPSTKSEAVQFYGNVNLTLSGNFNYEKYYNGYYLYSNSVVDITLQTGKLNLSNMIQRTGDWGTGSGITGVNTKFTFSALKDTTFIASNNDIAGMNLMAGSNIKLNFLECELVEMSNNKKSSGYHTGMDGENPSIILFENCKEVHLDNNYTDAFCFSTDDPSTSQLTIRNTPIFTMNKNGSWGTNGGKITIVNSYVDANENSTQPWSKVRTTASNICAYELDIINSVVNANGSGANDGFWVQGRTNIQNSTVYANNNGLKAEGYFSAMTTEEYNAKYGTSLPSGFIEAMYQANYSYYSANGLFLDGVTTIENSTVYATGNGGSGIALRHGYNTDVTSTFVNSKVIVDNNGKSESLKQSVIDNEMFYLYRSGIAVITGNLVIDNSEVSLKGNEKWGISYYPKQGSVTVKGNSIGYILSDTEEEIKGSNSNQATYVVSGSLQAILENMTGDYGDSWNDQKDEDEIYSGPINDEGTKLVEFDLNKEKNKEVNKDENSFVYRDPNTGKEYNYTFKYNNASQDLNGEGNNAYVWAPVSILRYDATEGFISSLGTSGKLNLGWSKTIELLDLIGKRYINGENGDVTIYGNSLDLAEKTLASAKRDGYKFLGWFVADDVELAKKYASENNFKELYKLLNTKFEQDTKVQVNGQDVSDLTIYAKWEKIKTSGKVIAHYVDEEGNTLHIDITSTGEVGSDYETTLLDIENYEFLRVDGETVGKYIDGTIEVTYVYTNKIGDGGEPIEPPHTGVEAPTNSSNITFVNYLYIKKRRED